MSLKPAPLYHSGVETASSLLSGGYRGSEIPDFIHSVVVLLFYLVPPLAVRVPVVKGKLPDGGRASRADDQLSGL